MVFMKIGPIAAEQLWRFEDDNLMRQSSKHLNNRLTIDYLKRLELVCLSVLECRFGGGPINDVGKSG